MKVKSVNPSLPESHERKSHEAGVARFLLDLREGELNDGFAGELMEPRLERFIGVIYRPETERWSHYSEAILPGSSTPGCGSTRRTAVTPLGEAAVEPHVLAHEDETYPFGL